MPVNEAVTTVHTDANFILSAISVCLSVSLGDIRV